MNVITATLILSAIELLFKTKEPVTDATGNVIAENLEDFRLKNSDDMFREKFGNVSMDDIKKIVNKEDSH